MTFRSLFSVSFRSIVLRVLPVIAGLFATPSVEAALSATFNAETDVPVTAASYTPVGEVDFTLNFAPEPGTNLTVVKNTGLPFIDGAFSNLANGATVNLSHNGKTYPFVAWYYGGEGNNDLVLLWPYTQVAGWGKDIWGQIGDGAGGSRYAPATFDNALLLRERTVVQIVTTAESSFVLMADGTICSWGSNEYGVLGINGAISGRSSPSPVNVNAGTSALAGKTVIDIAGGTSHCLALCSDGTLVAWGRNDRGQLGDGTTTQRSVPVAVSAVNALSGKRVVGIAAGSGHSLALCSDGTLAAWGANASGQLGDNTATSSLVPVQVNSSEGTSSLFGKTVSRVAAGGDHSLALCSDGTLMAWGSNVSGQLGDNSLIQRNAPVAVSTQSGTSALSGKLVTNVAAGEAFTMAMCSDGTVVGWGSNTYGQLGNNSTAQCLAPVPVNTDSGTSALHGKSANMIVGGKACSLAMCTDGTLAAWGDNTYGQLGENSTITRYMPVAVNYSAVGSILAGKKFIRIAESGGSQSHFFAIYGVAGEHLSIQGNGIEISHQDATPGADDHTYFGQINLHGPTVVHTFTITNRGAKSVHMYGSSWIHMTGDHPADFKVLNLSNTYLPFNESRTFKITFDPTGVGVRNAEANIVNDTSTTPFTFAIQGKSEDPEITVEQPVGTEISNNGMIDLGEVVAGSPKDLTFVVRNTGGSGSLMNGLAATLSGIHASQFSIIGSPATSLVGPDGFTSFVVRLKASSGGGPRTAQLNIANNDADENPYRIQLSANVASSVTATFHSGTEPAVTLNGLLATGMPVSLNLNFAPAPGTDLTVVENLGRELIQGSFNNLANGTTVNLSYNGMTYPFVVWYYGGEGNNDLVLLWPRTGLASWGPNSAGQLGNGTTLQRQAPGLVQESASMFGRTIVQISQGHNFAVGLTSTGETGNILAWGANAQKQAGIEGSATLIDTPRQISIQAGTAQQGQFYGQMAVAVSAGHSHSLALFANGEVAAWGAGSRGQLGNSSTATSSTLTAVTRTYAVLASRSVVSIAAGGNHNLALCSDGTVVAWGANEHGQLGDTTTTDRNEPVIVNAVSGTSALAGKQVVAISAGADHSLARCSDGTLVAWGRNDHGQLGINTTAASSVPVVVMAMMEESALFGRSVARVVASGHHNMALCTDGKLVAWGSNESGNLGDGTRMDRLLAVVVNPTDGGGALQGKSIVAFTGSQALCSDGTLAAWGYNQNGRVGDNSTTDRLTPVAVSKESGVSVLAGRKVSGLGRAGTSDSPSLALFGLDLLSKIGLTGNAQTIAHGDTTPSVTDNTDLGATNVTGGSVIRTYSVRNLEFLPLNLNGTPKVSISGPDAADFSVTTQPASPVAGFGRPSNFQITFDPTIVGERRASVSIPSDDPNTPVFSFDILGRGVTPTMAVEQPVGSTVVENDTRDFRKVPLGSGKNMVFTVKNTGPAESSLADFAITLDGMNAADFSIVDNPDAPLSGPDGLTTFTVRFSPSAGGARSAVLHLASNDPGDPLLDIQLAGEGFTELQATLNQGVDAAVEATDFIASGSTLNLTLNFAPAPGTNLTVIKNTGAAFIEGVFANVPNGGTVDLTYNGTTYRFVAWYYGGARNRDLVLLWPNTTLAGWGFSAAGQLTYSGPGSPENSRLTPSALEGMGELAGKTIVQVVQGSGHCLALTTEGRVYAWGWGDRGRLGVAPNDGSNRLTPTAVNTTSGVSYLAGKTVVAIAAGDEHSLALCSDGTVSGWGSDYSIQLGITGSGSFVPVRVANTSALSGKWVTAIAAGYDHSLVLCSDGMIFAWGTNSTGQLGIGTNVGHDIPLPVSQVSGTSALFGKTVVSLAAGYRRSMALCSDGTVVNWGFNDRGQLGDGTTTNRLYPVAVNTAPGSSALAGKTVTAITMGLQHTLALCSDGAVAAWGYNGAGQLGDESTTDRTLPVAVSTAEGASALSGKAVKDISAGSAHSLALCTDGTVASWGSNSYGQLGDATRVSRPVPVAVNAAAGTSVLAGQRVASLTGPAHLSQCSLVMLPKAPGEIHLFTLGADSSQVEIVGGDTTPSVDDLTDFGDRYVGSSLDRDFHVGNRGIEDVILTGAGVQVTGPNAADFVLVVAPQKVAGGRSKPISLSFRPKAIGLRTATVTVFSNDADEGAYSFTVQGRGIGVEIEVRESGNDVPNNSILSLGDVSTNDGAVFKTFVIHNLGTLNLTGLTITKFGQHPQDLTIITSPVAPVLPGGSTTLTVQFSPGASGLRSAGLRIANNDTDESTFGITFDATGIAGSRPTLTKPTATNITFEGATLKAQVEAEGSERNVFFEYGTTTAYGSRVTTTPASVTGITPTAVSATVAGLLPNTKYHFRARAEGVMGSVNGEDKTFTTLNRPPAAVADSAVVLPAGQVVIPVLSNDTDPGDVLNIASFTQPAATVGKVTKVGNTLVFTAAAGFKGGTFSYAAGDAFRGKSASAPVTLTLGTCSIGPDVTIPADSPPYELAVAANAPFGVIENVSWLSFVPPGPGATSVTFIPTPNAAKTSRTATVNVGGQTHTVTQLGVSELPVLTVPEPIPNAAISASYELAIPTQNGPVTYTATGLQKGLTLSNATGKITGYPTEAKTSTVTVKAKNAQGESNTINFDITVLDIPASVVGSFSATIESDTTLTDKLGGFMTMTVTKTGAVSGTLKLGAGSHPFTGKLSTAENPAEPDPEHAVLRTSVKRTGKPNVELLVRMNDGGTNFISGELTLAGTESASLDLEGSRHVWDAKTNPADNYKAYYTVALPTSNAAGIPQGDGFLTFTVMPAGAVSWSGQLPDGTAITAQTSALWADGRVPLFAVFGKGLGSLTQRLSISAGTRLVTGPLRWHKKPQGMRAYADGFESTTLHANGSEYLPPGAGRTLLNRTAPASFVVEFMDGGIEGVSNFSYLDQVLQLTAKHVLSISSQNPMQVKITKLDLTKGTFTGTLSLQDANPFNAAMPQVLRPVTFQGVLLPSLFMGSGYFLLPGIAGPPVNVKTSAMTSGQVRIRSL